MAKNIINTKNKIMQDDEFMPDHDSNWEKINNYYVLKFFEPVEYKINNNLIEDMKLYNRLNNKLLEEYGISNKNHYKNNMSKKIYRIYLIFDKYNFTINSTSYSVLKAVKINLRRLLSGERSNLNLFMNNLVGTRIKVLTFIKNLENYRQLDQIKKQYEEIYQKKIRENPFPIIYCYKIIKKISVSEENKLDVYIKLLKSYVYQFSNNQNKKKYIGVVQDTILDKGTNYLFDKIKKYNFKLKRSNFNDFNFKILKIIFSKTFVYAELEADYFIIKYDTINNGYNEIYNIGNRNIFFNCNFNRNIDHIRTYVFVNMQRELFDRYYDDEYDYSNLMGFVYAVINTNNNKKFISFSNISNDRIRTLRQIMLSFYNSAITGKNNTSKLIQALKSEPYNHFKLIILKKLTNNNKINISSTINKYINKYDSVYNGYNVSIINRNKRFTILNALKNTYTNI